MDNNKEIEHIPTLAEFGIIDRIHAIKALVKGNKVIKHIFLQPFRVPKDDDFVRMNGSDSEFREVVIYGKKRYLIYSKINEISKKSAQEHFALNEKYRNIGYEIYRTKLNVEKAYFLFKHNYESVHKYLESRDHDLDLCKRIFGSKKSNAELFVPHAHPEVDRCAEVVALYDKLVAKSEKALLRNMTYKSPEDMTVMLVGFLIWCNIMNDFAAALNNRFYSMYLKHWSYVKYENYATFDGGKRAKEVLEEMPAVIAEEKRLINEMLTTADFSGINEENFVNNVETYTVFRFMEYLYDNNMAKYMEDVPKEILDMFYAIEEEKHADDPTEEELEEAKKNYEHTQWVKQVIAETGLQQAAADYNVSTDNDLDIFVNSYMEAEGRDVYPEESSPADYIRYYEDSLAKGYIEDPHGLIKNLIDGYKMIYAVMGWGKEGDGPHIEITHDAYDQHNAHKNCDEQDREELFKKIHALHDVYVQATRNRDVPTDQKVIFHIPIYIDPYISGMKAPDYFEYQE